MMSVEITTDNGFHAGRPTVLFNQEPYNDGNNSPALSYSLHPDGQRFLMIKRGENTTGDTRRPIIVENWLEEVERLVPTE